MRMQKTDMEFVQFDAKDVIVTSGVFASEKWLSQMTTNEKDLYGSPVAYEVFVGNRGDEYSGFMGMRDFVYYQITDTETRGDTTRFYVQWVDTVPTSGATVMDDKMGATLNDVLNYLKNNSQ